LAKEKEEKNKMKKSIKKFPETNLTIILLSISLILIIVISKPFLENRPAKQLEPSPTPKEQPSTDTAVSPPPISFVLQKNYSLKPLTSFSVKVAPDKSIFASVYRIEILFDADVLTAEKVSAGDFFKTPQILRKEINNEQGRIYFSAGIGPEEKIAIGEPKSKNTLTTISFRVKSLLDEEKLSRTAIYFGKKTTIISKENKFENLNQTLEPIILKAVHE